MIGAEMYPCISTHTYAYCNVHKHDHTHKIALVDSLVLKVCCVIEKHNDTHVHM
jgi:hypothetical protein